MLTDPANPEVIADRLIKDLSRLPPDLDDLWVAYQLHHVFGIPVSAVAQTLEQPVSSVTRQLKDLDIRLKSVDTCKTTVTDPLRITHAAAHLSWDLLRISLHYGEQGDQLDRARGICRAVRERIPKTLTDLLHHERALIALCITSGERDPSALDEADALAREAGDQELLNIEHKLLADIMCALARRDDSPKLWEPILAGVEDYGNMNPAVHVLVTEKARGLEAAAHLAETRYRKLVEKGRPISLVFTVAQYRWNDGHPRKAQRLLQALDRRGLSHADRKALDLWLTACKERLAGRGGHPPRR